MSSVDALNEAFQLPTGNTRHHPPLYVHMNSPLQSAGQWIGDAEVHNGRTLYRAYRTRLGKEVVAGNDVMVVKEGQSTAGVAEDDWCHFEFYRVGSFYEEGGVRWAEVFRWLLVKDEVTAEYFAAHPEQVVHDKELMPELEEMLTIRTDRIHHPIVVRTAFSADFAPEVNNPYTPPVTQKLVCAKFKAEQGAPLNGQDGYLCCWSCYLSRADSFVTFRDWSEDEPGLPQDMDPSIKTPTAATFKEKCKNATIRHGGTSFVSIAHAGAHGGGPEWPSVDQVESESDEPTSEKPTDNVSKVVKALISDDEADKDTHAEGHTTDKQEGDDLDEHHTHSAHTACQLDTVDPLPADTLQEMLADCASDAAERGALALLAPVLGLTLPPPKQRLSPSPKSEKPQVKEVEVEVGAVLPSTEWLAQGGGGGGGGDEYTRLLSSVNTRLFQLREESLRPAKRRRLSSKKVQFG